MLTGIIQKYTTVLEHLQLKQMKPLNHMKLNMGAE